MIDRLIDLYNEYRAKYDDFPIVTYNLTEDQQESLIDVVELALRKSQEKLKQLNWVKKNINTENFGVCIRCNQNIPIERLLIVPEITKCVCCSR